jgi:glycosyltransferase involved in cell wall biosynthesis
MNTVFNIDYNYHRATGIGRYGMELMSAWISSGQDCSIWVPRWMWREGAMPEPFAQRALRYPVKRNITERFWAPLMAVSKKIDWIHSANCMLLPRSRHYRQACMVHDLGPFLYGQMKPAKDTEPWKLRLQKVAENADCILVNSNSTKNDMIKFFPETEERVFVTPLGIDHLKPVPNSERTVGKHILSVGTLEPRKNLDGLMRAYALLSGKRDLPPLVIAGGDGYRAEEYRAMPDQLGIGDSVEFTGFVSDNALKDLYSKAVCLVHPAHHEGFGFTVPEAFSWDLPVAASNTGGLGEFFKDCAWMIDPSKPESIALGIEWALEKGVTPAQKENRLSLSRKLTWKNCADSTINALESIQ